MRWVLVGAAVAALAMAVSGCGGSNEESSDTTTDATAIETTALTDTTVADTTSTEDTSTEDASTEDTSTEDTSTEATGALSDDCKGLVEAGQAFGAALSSATGNGTNDDLGATAEAYKAFADNAPDELKDDFETLAGVIGEYASAIGDLDLKAGETPSPSQIAKLVALSRSFSSADVQEASAAISSWTTENCGP